MSSSSLPALPISFITALVSLLVIALILRSPAGNRTSRLCFALLFGVFSLQAVLVGLRFGYGVDVFTPLQRALPFAVGPLSYFGFRALANPEILRDRAVRYHAGAALLAIAICWLAPLFLNPNDLPAMALNTVDLLIAISFVVYLTLLIILYRQGPDVFETAGFESVTRTRHWLLATILLLAGLLCLDGIIAFDFVQSSGRRTADLIGIGSALLIPALIAAALLYPQRITSQVKPDAVGDGPINSSDVEADRALIDALNTLFSDRGLYRDPDLNLTRLARRLSVPARRVSEAVNRELGLNVSQFVNNRRIKEATTLLAETDRSVAEIMEDAGFRTKSNFNREFRRVTGKSPQDYRHRQRTGDQVRL